MTWYLQPSRTGRAGRGCGPPRSAACSPAGAGAGMRRHTSAWTGCVLRSPDSRRTHQRKWRDVRPLWSRILSGRTNGNGATCVLWSPPTAPHRVSSMRRFPNRTQPIGESVARGATPQRSEAPGYGPPCPPPAPPVPAGCAGRAGGVCGWCRRGVRLVPAGCAAGAGRTCGGGRGWLPQAAATPARTSPGQDRSGRRRRGRRSRPSGPRRARSRRCGSSRRSGPA